MAGGVGGMGAVGGASGVNELVNGHHHHHHHHLPYSTGHFFSVLRTGLYASSPEPHECHGQSW